MKLALLAVYLALPLAVQAADCPQCPTPKRLTCDQLIAKAEARGCLEHLCNETPCDNCCPPPTVVEGPGKIIEVPGKERVVEHYIYQDVPPKPQGYWFAGVGPVYFHGIGGTVQGGYSFANGLTIFGGPFYVPQNNTPAYGGVATRGCVSIPYTVAAVPADNPWGGAVLLGGRW